jgi:hypothetical protein
VIATGVAFVVAAGVDSGAAALLAMITPYDRWTWMWIAVIPLGIALEIGFEIVVEFFGAISRFARAGAIVSLLVAFYVIWFMLRPISAAGLTRRSTGRADLCLQLGARLAGAPVTLDVRLTQ